MSFNFYSSFKINNVTFVAGDEFKLFNNDDWGGELSSVHVDAEASTEGCYSHSGGRNVIINTDGVYTLKTDGYVVEIIRTGDIPA